MPEPVDMIVPMLQRMQTDISDIKTCVSSLDARVGNLEERFEAIGTYITFTVGLHAQNKADAEANAEEIAEIKRRIDALEAAQS